MHAPIAPWPARCGHATRASFLQAIGIHQSAPCGGFGNARLPSSLCQLSSPPNTCSTWLSDVVQAIGTDAAQARPLPHDAVTEAGTEGPRAALADTFRSFFLAVEESNARHHGFLPRTFELTDRSVAELIICALDLGPNDVVDAGYVKRLRQRRCDRDTGVPAEATR